MSLHVPVRRLLPSGVAVLAAFVAVALGTAPAQASPMGATTSAVTSLTTSSRLADSAGAPAPGSMSYTVPTGAVFAAPGGSDTASGSQAAPVRTIARALAIAPSGGTVVLRAGTYHESLVIGRKVTIQNYPGEAAWLDGSVKITGWVKDGSAWRHDGWTPRFDASVGFNKGAVDGASAGWQWLNPSYPMAAHPDQVFFNGTQLRQVASRSQVVAGTFYLDESTSRLYVGSDPTNVEVRGTTLARAMRILGPGTLIRGIGVRRYAPSIWHIGAVTIEAAKVRLNHVTITDSATIGVGVVASDVCFWRVSILRSGLLGVHASYADRLLIRRSRIDNNNTERFNSAPVSGGIKSGRTRTLTVKDSSVSNNLGQGYWSDESVYDTRILNSNLVGNRAAGVFLEISARGTIANNIISGNGGDGVKINNTSTVTIYNNTVVRNGRALNLVQDTRLPSNTSYGHDSRYPNDPEMTWLTGPVTVRNNVIGLPTSSATCVLCVEDYSFKRTAAQMGVTSNGNVFNRPSSTSTRWLTVWSRGSINVDPAVYTTLPGHKSGTGQDSTSLGYDGSTVVATDSTLSSTVQGKASTVAVPLPSSIATLTDLTSGVRRLGAFGRG